LDALVQLTAPKKTLLGVKFPQKTRVFLAALSALRKYQADKRAEKILAAAANARDPDVVRAATGGGGGDK
jgi:hypothetical protein